MSEDLQRLFQLIVQSFTEPSKAAQSLFGRRYDGRTLWSGMLLVTVLSVLLIALSNALMGVPSELEGAIVQVTPFAFSFILGASLCILVFAIHYMGRAMGGTANFNDSILCVIWLQVLSMALQVVQIVSILILPAIAGLVSLVGLGLILYALTNFINVLHSFDSLFKALGTFVLSLIGIAFGLSIILAVVGVSAQGIG